MTLVALASSCLVGSYEFLRVSIASLFIDKFGAGAMSYALTAVPFFMAALIWLYAKTLSKLGPRRTAAASFLFSALVFLAGYAGNAAGLRWSIAFTYLFVEVYIVVLVEQIWSFVNSSLNKEEARLLNGPIAGLAAVGPVLAGFIASRYAKTIGTESFILLAAALMLPSAWLLLKSYSMLGEPKPAEAEAKPDDELDIKTLLHQHPLMAITSVVFLSQVIATLLNLHFYQILEGTITSKDLRTAYLGGFWMKVNLVAFAMQFAGTPLLLRFTSLRFCLTAIPVLHLFNAILLFKAPSLGVAAYAFIAFKSLDYSLFRASKELLYIPLSFSARYRAKQVADSFTYRFSKGVTAGSVSLWKAAAGAVAPWSYPVFCAAAAACWAIVSIPLTRDAK